MLTKKSKFYLSLIAKLKPSPKFFFIYSSLWFLWHNEFMITLISTQADPASKIQAAIAAVPDNQYMLVLFFTIAAVLLLNGFDYLGKLSSDEEDTSIVELLKNSNTAEDEEENDIKYVVSALAATKKKLAYAIDREHKMAQEKTVLVSKLLTIQNQLDEITADNMILQSDIAKLKKEV
jgi:hypothetical protein